jgi:site-specific DNA recombinase
MLVCERCGYALYRTSTQTSARKLYYYWCLGSDAYRHLRGAVCDNPPVRQDYLDAVVWKEMLRLLEDPGVIQEELNRRLEAARKTDPLKQREELLHRERARLEKNMDRLLNAYQEGLVSLEQLHGRMLELRQQPRAAQAELQSLKADTADHAHCLRLVETLTDFCARLRLRADALEVTERQKIVRLLRKRSWWERIPLRSVIQSGYRMPGLILAERPARLTTSAAADTPTRPRLSFAFRPSSARCCRTSIWTRSTTSWPRRGSRW